MSEYRNHNDDDDNDGVVKKFKSAQDFKEYFLDGSKFEKCSKNDSSVNDNKRRASIPANLNNYNIRVYNSRRYSEIVLGPTVRVQRERLSKSDTNSASKINGGLSDTLNKRIKSKNQITRSHNINNDDNDDFTVEEDKKNEGEENGKQISKNFINHLEETVEESDGIAYESDDDEFEEKYGKFKGTDGKRKSWDRDSNESEKNMTNGYGNENKNKTNLKCVGDDLENEETDGKFSYGRKNSTDDTSYRINVDVRSDAFQRR